MEFNEKRQMFVREGTLDDFVCGEINSSYKAMDLRPQDRVMDIGGNIGAFAAWASPKCNSVISYEPDESNFYVLTKNTDRFHNIRANNAALINGTERTVDFYLNKGKNKGMHSTVERRGRDKVTVNAMNFDNELMVNMPNKVKMDIEGGEFGLLLDKHIPDFVKVLAIEIHLNKKLWRLDQAPKLIDQLASQFDEILVQPKITEGNWATVGIYRRA